MIRSPSLFIFFICRTGFSLLELLVVLLLISLLTGIIGPRLPLMYDSLRYAYEFEEVHKQISQLGYLARLHGTDYTLRTYPPSSEDFSPPPLDLPSGWKLLTAQPIQFNKNGICQGGEIELTYGRKQQLIRLEPPFCN